MLKLTDTICRIQTGPLREAVLKRAPQCVAALLVVVVAWQLAGMTWLLAAGPQAAQTQDAPAASRPVSGAASRGGIDVNRVTAAHLFGRAGAAAPAVAVAAPEEMPETRLNLRLRGVIANDDPGLGIAIIADDRGQERLYRVEQAVPGGARLQAVHSDQVVLNRNGVLETLRLPREMVSLGAPAEEASPPAVASPAQQPPGSPRPSVQQVVSDNAARITDLVRIQPHLEGGQMRGYRLFPGRDEEHFRELGLQPGDLVTAVEGTPLSDPSRGLEIFAALGEATQVNITIERDGSQQTMMLDTETLSRVAGAALQ